MESEGFIYRGGSLTLTESVLTSLSYFFISLCFGAKKYFNGFEKGFFGGFLKGKVKVMDNIPVEKKLEGLGVGSFYFKNLSLLGKWWSRFKLENDALLVKVIECLYREKVVSIIGQVRGYIVGRKESILNCVLVMDNMCFSFSTSFCRKLGVTNDC